jgi:hypothetical protein
MQSESVTIKFAVKQRLINSMPEGRERFHKMRLRTRASQLLVFTGCLR